eukprot:1449740-Prorocentrum_lima.AAC.1
MTSSLVGSEMCIRDRHAVCGGWGRELRLCAPGLEPVPICPRQGLPQGCPCLLYTSDAADDM